MHLRSLTVAIVEDDDLVRSATASLLRSLGLKVVSFCSALDFLAASPAALECIVSDLNMVGMSGIELYDTMVAKGTAVPFILLTGFPTEQIRKRARESGIRFLLEKSGRPEQLVACLVSILGPLGVPPPDVLSGKTRE